MILSTTTLLDAEIQLMDIVEELKNPNLSEIGEITLRFEKKELEDFIFKEKIIKAEKKLGLAFNFFGSEIKL